MNALQIFSKGNMTTRAFEKDGDVWFIARDVCDELGLDNMSRAISTLDEDDVGVSIIETAGGSQEMTIVSESGLYSLVFKSRKPEARAFQKWVTKEVLPSIRKTGSYSIYTIERTDRLIEKLSELQLTFDDCKDESSNSHLRTFKQTARLLNTPGMNESALYRFCNNIGATWFWSSTPFTHFIEIGYLEGVILRETRKNVMTQTKWTKKGIAWLIVQMSLAGMFEGDRRFKDIAIERKSW